MLSEEIRAKREIFTVAIKQDFDFKVVGKPARVLNLNRPVDACRLLTMPSEAVNQVHDQSWISCT